MSEPKHPIILAEELLHRTLGPRVDSFMEKHPKTAETLVNASLDSIQFTDRIRAKVKQKIGGLFSR